MKTFKMFSRPSIRPEMILHFLLAFQLLALAQATVDYQYCKAYPAPPADKPDYIDPSGRPIILIGSTWSKNYYLVTSNYTRNYFDAAYGVCRRFNLQLASIKTACDYGVFEKYFFSQVSTQYSGWIAGFRLGDSTQPPPFWITTGEPLNFRDFEMDPNYIPGPYPPGGYSPIPYPWINCLSVSRNCPLYTSGPTNPCTQTPTNPKLQFMWADCRTPMRIFCEEISYTKEGSSTNEIDNI